MPHPVDPKLPAHFDETPNDERPLSHLVWWEQPFIVTRAIEAMDTEYDQLGGTALAHWLADGRARWLEAWPGGTRYEARCLDGGAWDRSTCWGFFGTLEQAEACCASGGPWRRGRDLVRAAKVVE
jgi:hypothetical protein